VYGRVKVVACVVVEQLARCLLENVKLLDQACYFYVRFEIINGDARDNCLCFQASAAK